jgi:hypothetical protein
MFSPYAGMIQIRFIGFDLSPYSTMEVNGHPDIGCNIEL